MDASEQLIAMRKQRDAEAQERQKAYEDFQAKNPITSAPVENNVMTPPTFNEIQQTQQDRLQLKQENDAMEAELLRAEKLRAQARMAGKSFMIPPQKPETFEDKWRREAKSRYKDLGMDPT